MSQWFYIQQWARKRWSYVGMEMPFKDALNLFHTLSDEFSETNCKPLAVVRKVSDPTVGKVIQSKDELTEDWVELVANAMYVNGGNPEPLLVKRVSNE